MMAYLIKEPQYIKLNMEERIIMVETLGDAISSISDRKLFYNRYVKKSLARTAAMVENSLRRKQVHFVDMKRAGLLDENKRKILLIQIMELKEELEELRCRMTFPAKIEMDTETRRCVFRTINDPNVAMTLMDFVRIYNKWADDSAEYLILIAIREIECAAFNNNNSSSNFDKITPAQIALTEEYNKKISEKKNILHSYCEELRGIAEELDEEYGIFDILDKLSEDNAAIKS